MSSGGFHEGELAVQRRAGVDRQAARLAGMLAPPDLDGRFSNFLAGRDFVVVTGRDHTGRLWISPVLGPAGFLEAEGTTLRIHGTPPPGDPLSDLPADQPVGLVAIDFATRRRVRVNGVLTAVTATELQLTVDQAYGNCPSYIQQRQVRTAHSAADPEVARSGTRLEAEDVSVIERADTFFLGTIHPTRGADASHRGGPPGFVRIEGDHLWWPDYPGNNLFNSMGNLAVDPTAALLFMDFGTGASRSLSGQAQLEWATPEGPGDDGGTGRRIRFTPTRVAANALPLRALGVVASPRNPELSD